VQTVERLALYLRPDELHTAFNFAFLTAAWAGPELRKAVDDSMGALEKVGAPPTWVLSNHDVVRHVTRYGGGELGLRRARAAALLMLALPGSAYVYQGEELGLPEVEDLPDGVRRDPVFHRTGGAEPGRDGCRVPLPWSEASASLGFGPAGATWLPQPAAWKTLTVERQKADPSSILNLYRAALAQRRALPKAGFSWLPSAENVLAFSRGPDFLCVVNVGEDPVPAPAATLLLSSDPHPAGDSLRGGTAAWFAR
jgi:alpha-glucosidase